MAGIARFLRTLIYGRSPATWPLRGDDIPEEVMREMAWVMRLQSSEVMREYTTSFEKEFARHVGVRHALGVDSGTSALYFALKAVDVGDGDEVITVANTFIATVTAIREAGATCRFVDIDARTGVMDVSALAEAIGPNTKAVIPVHMYGQPVDMAAVMALCRPRGIAVIEDACQGIGASTGGRPAGAWGDIGCYSFHVNKLVGAPADGGMLVTDDPRLAARLRAQVECDWPRALTHTQPRVPSRLPPLSVPLLRARLGSLDALVAARRRQRQVYEGAIRGVADSWLLDCPGPGVSSCRSTVLVSERVEAVKGVLKSAGWEPRPMYIPTAAFVDEVLKQEGGRGLSQTDYFVKHHVLLPMGHALDEAALTALSGRLGQALSDRPDDAREARRSGRGMGRA